MPVLAYLITFHTYGSYLHGNSGGSVDRAHNTYGTPFLPASSAREEHRRGQLKHEVVQLDESQRWVVDRTVRDVCEHRRWKLHAVHVRTTHVHVLVTAPDPADKVLVDLKAWATRRMREAGVLGAETRAWSHHGSTKYINTAESLEGAIRYVLHEQGEVLPMTPPPA